MRQRTFEKKEKKENRDILLFRKFAHLYYKDPNVLGFFGIFLIRFYCYDCSLCAFLSATFFLNCDYRLLFE